VGNQKPTPEPLINLSGRVTGMAAFTHDGDGADFVIGRANYLAYNDTAAAWEHQEIPGAARGDEGEFTSLVLNVNGPSVQPLLSYYDVTKGIPKVSARMGTRWEFLSDTGEGVEPFVSNTQLNLGFFTSVAVNSTGLPRVAYQDQSDTALKFARWNGTAWNQTYVDNADDVGEYASLAVNMTDGAHHIAYYDASGKLKYVSGTGAASTTSRSVGIRSTTPTGSWIRRAARSLPMADRNETLLIGHSEGGQVVSLLAAENPFVTHVAVLSTTAPTMLFAFMQRAREGRLYPHLPPDPEKQVAQLLSDIAEIYGNPDSDEITFGHSHRYWASRWPFSPMEALTRTTARIFLARGSADGSEAIINFDLVYTNLLANSKDVTARLVEGADHGFQFADQPQRDGWKEIFEAVRDWFFQ